MDIIRDNYVRFDADKQLLLGMITVAHYDFWYCTYKNKLTVRDGITTSGEFEIDEEFDGYGHPLIQQEEGKEFNSRYILHMDGTK